MIRALVAALTGGRPMTEEEFCAFVDTVTGEYVNGYRDLWGRRWLATGRWSLFRIPRLPNPDDFPVSEPTRWALACLARELR